MNLCFLAFGSVVAPLLLSCSSLATQSFGGEDATVPRAPGAEASSSAEVPSEQRAQDGAVPSESAPAATPPVPATVPDGGEAGAAGEAPATPAPEPAAVKSPWRLDEAIGAPDWLEIAVESRLRYENLSENIRKEKTGHVTLFALRTLIAATVHFDPFRGTLEIADSRATFESERTDLTSSIVNEAEFLQLYFGFETEDQFASGDRLDFKLGRQTIRLGSRRFIHRNGFRNTINAFTGLRSQWFAEDGDYVNAFVVVPVRRLPDEPAEIDNDQVQFDEEQWGTRLWNLHGQTDLFDEQYTGEAFGFWLDENDREEIQTRDRKLVTLGARLHHFGKPGDYQFEWESAYQFGTSRKSPSAADTTDLDHQAHFHHLTLGYRFDGAWTPQLEALFDYASGDKDPDDDKNERFDPLYGPGAFEFGRTGVFAPFNRSNIISPGARLWMYPTKKWALEFTFRPVWLASSRDVWTQTGVQDPTGNSGSFVGDLSQFAFRYDIIPKNLRFDFGYAYLAGGEFSENAPNALGPSDTSFVWAGMQVNF